MKIGEHDWNLDPLGKHIWRGRMETGQLLALARAVKEEGGQLVALWGSDDRHLASGFGIHVALLTSSGLAWVSCALPTNAPAYPDLAHIFPQADRMQRATFDLLGIRATDAVDDRKWLRHGAWPANVFPLRKDFDATLPATLDTDAYPFIRVEGEGVHEIPVGPIHAGTFGPNALDPTFGPELKFQWAPAPGTGNLAPWDGLQSFGTVDVSPDALRVSLVGIDGKARYAVDIPRT